MDYVVEGVMIGGFALAAAPAQYGVAGVKTFIVSRALPISGSHRSGSTPGTSPETARERNHLRIWLAPWRLHGRAIWVGQISRDIGLTFNWRHIVGHEVDPDVDEARNYLVQDMLRAQGVQQFGWVKGVGAAPPTAPRSMTDGTPFFTDGLRAVMIFAAQPTSVQDIELFDWEKQR